MSATFFPSPSFNFKVSIGSEMKNEASFQEVTGLEAELEVEEVIVGGQNNFVYQLPKRTRFKPVVLKRGFFKKNSKIFDWVKKFLLEDGNITKQVKTEDVKISLCNERGEELREERWNENPCGLLMFSKASRHFSHSSSWR